MRKRDTEDNTVYYWFSPISRFYTGIISIAAILLYFDRVLSVNCSVYLYITFGDFDFSEWQKEKAEMGRGLLALLIM